MGLTGTGSAVKYIPRPVIIGFTNGIALVIASTQLKDFLGWPSTCRASSSAAHRGDRRAPSDACRAPSIGAGARHAGR